MADAPASTDAPADKDDASTETPETPDAATPDKDDMAQWKALARKHEKAEKAAKAELDKLRAASMSEQEQAVAKARDEGKAEATAALQRERVRDKVEIAAAGKLQDPDVAAALLGDLDQFITDDGIDTKAIAAAIDVLIKTKPYLGTQPGSGSGEGGPRGRPDANSLNGDALEASLRSAVGA